MKLQNHDEFLKICDLLDECYYHCDRNVPKMGRWKLYCKDCENLLISRLPVYTKINNLYLTGQNVILHGICGVPLTAINTAEAILGKNLIINAIRQQNEDC